MIAYIIDSALLVLTFALQIGLPRRTTIVAAAVILTALVIQLTVGRNNDNYFVVFILMMITVLALLVRGVRGQLQRRTLRRDPAAGSV